MVTSNPTVNNGNGTTLTMTTVPDSQNMTCKNSKEKLTSPIAMVILAVICQISVVIIWIKWNYQTPRSRRDATRMIINVWKHVWVVGGSNLLTRPSRFARNLKEDALSRVVFAIFRTLFSHVSKKGFLGLAHSKLLVTMGQFLISTPSRCRLIRLFQVESPLGF